VTRGRREEFAAFGWAGEVPDPQDPATFARSRLNWELQEHEPHCWLRELYRALLSARREFPALGVGRKRRLAARVDGERTFVVLRKGADGAAAVALLNFSPEARTVRVPALPGRWRRLVDTAEERFGGPGPLAPRLFDIPRRGMAAVDLTPWGAAICVRERTVTRGMGTAG
jgi:maltooligosyltrehalose trehalohydrolase